MISMMLFGSLWNFYPRPPRGGRRTRRVYFHHHRTFLSTPSARRATPTPRALPGKVEFLSTPSARRATHAGQQLHDSSCISIHALREEGDAPGYLSTSSRKNFYPRPPRGGRPVIYQSLRQNQLISIHALREEGDLRRKRRVCGLMHFYPRPPRGGRPYAIGDLVAYNKFLSTPSARRATCRDCQRNHTWRFLSTPSARRATYTN